MTETNNPNIIPLICEGLKNARISAGMTLKEAKRQSGINVSKIEKQTVKDIRISIIFGLCDLYQISVKHLLSKAEALYNGQLIINKLKGGSE